MASAVYPTALASFVNQNPSIDVDTDTIKVAAVSDVNYTYSAAHQYKSSVTSYTGSTDATVTITSTTGGVVDGSDLAPAFSSLAQNSTDVINALVVYKDTGVAATSPLICYIDLASPTTPNGGDINITWNGSGIFSI